jgi:hypothetical protein
MEVWQSILITIAKCSPSVHFGRIARLKVASISLQLTTSWLMIVLRLRKSGDKIRVGIPSHCSYAGKNYQRFP